MLRRQNAFCLSPEPKKPVKKFSEGLFAGKDYQKGFRAAKGQHSFLIKALQIAAVDYQECVDYNHSFLVDTEPWKGFANDYLMAEGWTRKRDAKGLYWFKTEKESVDGAATGIARPTKGL